MKNRCNPIVIQQCWNFFIELSVQCAMLHCACKHINFIVRFHAPQCTFIKYIKCRCHSCSIDKKKNCCWICALNCQQKQQFHLADAKHRYRRHLSGWWYAQYAMYQIQAFRHFNAKRAHAHFHYPHSTYY